MPTYNVMTYATYNFKTRRHGAQAYLRDADPTWGGCVMIAVDAATGKDAKREAKRRRIEQEEAKESATVESRYELLEDDERFKLKKGDVLICESMHWAWAPEKVAVVKRESDGYEPECSQYRGSVRWLTGPRL